MSSSEVGHFQVVPLAAGHFSDGDDACWPKENYWREVSDQHYRHKLAMMLMQERGQLHNNGMNYIFAKLPDKYILMDRPRFSNPSIRDKFLWGHPSGSYFNSPNQFLPHFRWLMSGGSGTCHCECCRKKTMAGNIPDRSRTSTPHTLPSSSRGRSRGNLGAVKPNFRTAMDPEGTPDVFRNAILKLKELGTLAESITEPQSMDWRAENKSLREHIVRLSLQGAYIPRAGEVVLWVPEMEGEIVYDDQSDTFRFYSEEEKRFLGVPEWRAGVVGQTPEETVVLEDLIEPMPKKWAVNYSGFRLETFPDPNGLDKSASLHYKYIHLRNIRPFYAWSTLLQGVDEKQWQPSIKHAMTVMSSISLVDRYFFKGTWPNGSVYCRGLFLGPEILVVGDTVRLKPQGATRGQEMPEVTDVMAIDRIEFRLISCIDDVKSPLLAEKHAVRVRGKVYTLSPNRAYRAPGQEGPPKPLSPDEVINAFQQVGMNGYGSWYPVQKPGSSVEVSQDMIVGRCYEPIAMKLLFDDQSLGYDLDAMLSSRWWSRQTDNRMRDGQDWFWGDYRTQTLAIDSLNGEDVARYSDARDPKMWKGVLAIIDGKATLGDYDAARLPRNAAGRPATNSNTKSKFAGVGKMSTLVSSGLNMGTSGTVSSDSEDSEEQPEEVEMVNMPPAPGRRDVIKDSEESDEEEEEKEEEMEEMEEEKEEEEDDDEEDEEKKEEDEEEEEEDKKEEASSSESEDFSQPLPLRGGTEEPSSGDYSPPGDEDEVEVRERLLKQYQEQQFKRPRFDE